MGLIKVTGLMWPVRFRSSLAQEKLEDSIHTLILNAMISATTKAMVVGLDIGKGRQADRQTEQTKTFWSRWRGRRKKTML